MIGSKLESILVNTFYSGLLWMTEIAAMHFESIVANKNLNRIVKENSMGEYHFSMINPIWDGQMLMGVILFSVMLASIIGGIFSLFKLRFVKVYSICVISLPVALLLFTIFAIIIHST